MQIDQDPAQIEDDRLWRAHLVRSVRHLKNNALSLHVRRLRYKSDAELATKKTEFEFHHNVYVILLDPKVAKHPTILRINPKRDPAKPCVYVGMSGLPPEHRFENHKHGYKAAWVVEKYGVRLLPELYEHLNPMPYEAALQMELELAEDLRNEGYTVTGGH